MGHQEIYQTNYLVKAKVKVKTMFWGRLGGDEKRNGNDQRRRIAKANK